MSRLLLRVAGAVGGEGGDEDDKEKEEEAERERQEAIREAEERRKEKHRKMEEEREKMRQEIRDKVGGSSSCFSARIGERIGERSFPPFLNYQLIVSARIVAVSQSRLVLAAFGYNVIDDVLLRGTTYFPINPKWSLLLAINIREPAMLRHVFFPLFLPPLSLSLFLSLSLSLSLSSLWRVLDSIWVMSAPLTPS
jgi:complexin-1/2